MKLVPLGDSIGMVLAHDMTEIIPGRWKGAAFKKGHIIREEDIPRLLNMGKEHIGIIEYKANSVHENEAAIRMGSAAAGPGLRLTKPSEGKVSLIAEIPGLLKVNYRALLDINCIDDLMIATLHTNQLVDTGTVIAGTRIVPLITEEERITKVEKICKKNYPVIQIMPLRRLKAGIITTGSEVFHRRIPDEFGPVIYEKFEELDCEVMKQIYSNDDSDIIAQSINTLIEENAEIIAVTGGMSVDPDDVTPLGIRKSGAEIISYGAPTLPGAMFMLAYKNGVPIIGLPGCVMYSKRTIFDWILPRLLSGERVTREDISRLGQGALCMGWKDCRYPSCGVGKGGRLSIDIADK